jgi:HEAT repeat protein
MTPASSRAEDLIVGFGAPAAGRMASLAGDSRWFVQLAAARILGRIASADSVPLLQPLLRKSDPRVAREAVAALGAISDPSAARAIHNVLRSATGDFHQVVIETLGALGAVRHDAAIRSIENVINIRRFFGRKKLRALKESGVAALVAIGTPKAEAALEVAKKTGDRMLRKAIQSTKYKGQSTK